MRAGLEKILVLREVGERVSSGGIVLPEQAVDKKVGEVVWGQIEDLGPRGKAGMAFGKGAVAYDVRVAKVVEKGQGYVREVIDEMDVLAFNLDIPVTEEPEGEPEVEKPPVDETPLEDTTDGPTVEGDVRKETVEAPREDE
jgi:co-chaperonin GroES (HSP10)